MREYTVNKNSAKLFGAYTPVWWYQTLLGQMPFRLVKQGPTEQQYYYLVFSKFSIRLVIVCVMFVIFICMYMWVLVGFAYFFIADVGRYSYEVWDEITKSYVTLPLEKFRIKEMLIPTVALLGLLTVTGAGFVTIFIKGGTFVEYFNYWNTMVQIMDIDPTKGVRGYFIKEMILAVAIMILFVGDFAMGFFKKAPGGHGRGFVLTATFANLMFGVPGLQSEGRFYDPFWFNNKDGAVHRDKYDPDHFGYEIIPFYGIGLIVVAYSILGSRCQILPFLFFSRLLTNATAIWNERLKNALIYMEPGKSRQSRRRLEFSTLLKDHLVLVRLFKMTEYRFSVSVVMYYVVNLFCVILESYYIVKILLSPLTSNSKIRVVIWNATENKYVQPSRDFVILPADGKPESEERAGRANEWDNFFKFLLILLLLLYQSFVTYQITSQGSRAFENAVNGFNILRRHGFMYCKSATEQNFIHSLVISFARNNPMLLTGGGYFVIQRTLITGILSTWTNFLIFMYQYRPDDWTNLEYRFRDR